MQRRPDRRRPSATGCCVIAALALAATACGRPASGSVGESLDSVPEGWRAGAVERIRDVFYVADLPTFVNGGRPDPIAVVEAAVLLDLAGRPVAPSLSLAELQTLVELDVIDRLMLADEFSELAGEMSETDVAEVTSLLELVDITDPYVAVVHDRLRLAAGLPLDSGADCPTTDAVGDDLYLAGAMAQRIALRGGSCGRLDAPVGSGSSTLLTAELIEDVRAQRALATVGAIDHEVADASSERLVAAVEAALLTESPSRSFLQLVHHAATADPAVGAALTDPPDEFVRAIERTIRWMGSLPDTVTGVDLDATVHALRAVAVLDPEAASVVADQMTEGTVPSEYAAVIELAAAGRLDTDVAALGHQLPAPIAVPVVARFGSCADVDSVKERAAGQDRATGDAVLDGLLASTANRCGTDADAGATSSAPAGTADDVLFRAAGDCADSDRPSDEVTLDADAIVAALEWTWQPGELPTVQEIARRTTLIELAGGSCAGFWWSER